MESRIRDLETRLLGDFESTLGESLLQCKYHPHYFVDMLNEYGALGTAKRLLGPNESPQSGLFRLHECGRLDPSMEAIVLKEAYRQLFTDEELGEARERLKALGYAPP